MSVRQLLVLTGVALALLVVPSAVADPPTLTLPSSFTVSVDGPGPYPVSYSASAIDTETGPVALSCDHDSGSDFPYGGTFVTCSATDPGDLTTASDSFTITVTDTTAPSLSLPSPNPTVEVVGLVPATVTYTATQNDAGTVSTAGCSPNSGSSFSYGSTPVTCTATDNRGNTNSQGFTVVVHDTIPPTLTVPPSFTAPPVNGVLTENVTYSASATEGGTPSCDHPSGSSFPLGATLVTCTATDAAGNTSAPTSFTVTVSDTTPPVITVPASIRVNINNATSTVVTYTATAADGPASITPTCAPASGSSFPLGVTTVTCNATDAAGNPAAPKSFTVTVVDNTAPAVSVTGGPAALSNLRTASLDFTTSEGATTCQLDGGAFATCTSPAAYSGLADGNHTFTVKATDAANNSATASRAWKVDATAPVLSLPTTRIGEADGPNGAVASFNVSASDGGGALLPSAITCTPGSGTLFPLGTTIVSCRASDTAGNVATGAFDVIIQDTTAPAINAPNVSFTATGATGARKTDPAVVAYLAGISASDLVSTPTLTNDMPNVLPIGPTTVVFTATDAAGNVAKKSVTVTVLPVGQKAPPPDLTPPGDVIGAKAKAGDRLVTLSWNRVPNDVVRIAITEFVVGTPRAGREIYDGIGNTVTTKGLVNGTAYRFLIVTYDRAGNRSKGVVLVATPKVEALTSPAKAQRVTRPPLLRWAPLAGAGYYNVQLWRGSVKVLSTWPTVARLQLTAKWTYGGKPRKLAAGVYTWYVWPGLGPRADARYGSLLGSRTFTYVAAKSKK